MPMCKSFKCRNCSGRCDKSFFTIPDPKKSIIHEKLCKLWITNLRNPELDFQTFEHSRALVVCEDHFEDTDFRENNYASKRLNGKQSRKRLILGSVPKPYDDVRSKSVHNTTTDHNQSLEVEVKTMEPSGCKVSGNEQNRKRCNSPDGKTDVVTKLPRISRAKSQNYIPVLSKGQVRGRPPKRTSCVPSDEEKKAYIEDVECFIKMMNSQYADPFVAKLFCPLNQKKLCGCLQNRIKSSGEASTESVHKLIGLIREAVELRKEKVYPVVVDNEVNRSIGLGNGHKRSKQYETFVLTKRQYLREELHLCERATQKILMYSNNFLHKRLKTENRSRQRERTRQRRSAVDRDKLPDFLTMRNPQCCSKNCVMLAMTHTQLLQGWKSRAQSGKAEARRVVAEMLTTAGACYQFIYMVSGCSKTISCEVYKQIQDTGGVKNPQIQDTCGVKNPQIQDTCGVKNPQMQDTDGIPQIQDTGGVRDPQIRDTCRVRNPQIQDTGGVRDPQMQDLGRVENPQIQDTGGVRNQQIQDTDGVKNTQVQDTGGVKNPLVQYIVGVINPHIQDTVGFTNPQIQDTCWVRNPQIQDTGGVWNPQIQDTGGVKKPQIQDTGGVRNQPMQDIVGVVINPQIQDTGGVWNPQIQDTGGVNNPQIQDTGGVKKPQIQDTGGVKNPQIQNTDRVKNPQVHDTGGVRKTLGRGTKRVWRDQYKRKETSTEVQVHGRPPKRTSCVPSDEEKKAYIDDVECFIKMLRSQNADPFVAKLFCPLNQKKLCGCLQKRIKSSGEASTELVSRLIGLIREAVELRREKVYPVVVDNEVNRSIGLGNGHKRSKQYETFVLTKRQYLREDLHLCERATQKILMYSNNFLHKRLKTENRSRQRERKRQRRSAVDMDKLPDFLTMRNLQCCLKNCVMLAMTHTQLLQGWRSRAQSGKAEARRVVAEMLTTTGACYHFIFMVSGCSKTISCQVFNQMQDTDGVNNPQILDTGGVRNSQEHGIKRVWLEHYKRMGASTEGSAEMLGTGGSTLSEDRKTRMIQESGDKAFICGICGSSFKLCAHLKWHIRIHTSEKTYECDGPAFTQTPDMNLHEEVYTDGSYR